jgi:DNA primase
MSNGPVVDEIAKYVTGLKKGAGNNWMGFCPIHGEQAGKSKPSFSLNAATGMWYCFAGCGGGGLPTFLKLLDVPRPRVDTLMEKLRPHLTTVEKRADLTQAKNLFQTPYPLPEKLLGIYEECPVSLIEAGFTEETLWTHDVGFDEEQQRITFPIRDLNGTLAGISGRDVTGRAAEKYKVYQRELQEIGFKNYKLEKGNYLYRWERVYQNVYANPDRPPVYITEGFKACLWMVQNGFPNTVALMGSSMTDVQKMFIERLGGPVVLCLDNNSAGIKGTARIGYRLSGARILVMRYPPDVQQPDGLSAEALQDAVQRALSLTTWSKQHHESNVIPRFRYGRAQREEREGLARVFPRPPRYPQG